MSTRVYVTGNWEAVNDEADPPRDYEGHAVTSELRAACPDWDDEQLEHYAMTEAAQASLHRLADHGERMRRLVMTVDATAVEPVTEGLTAVVVRNVAVRKDAVAFMVDTQEAEADVAAAVAALRVADDVDADDVRPVLDRCLDHELAWFAATEIDQVFGPGPQPEADPL